MGHYGTFAPRFRARTAGIVLAGGRGRRVDGRDKGLLRRRGRPLVSGPAGLLARHCQRVLISANRHQARYARFEDRVLADTMPDFAGPLAGISAGMRAVRARRVVILPCDAAGIPADLPARLLRALALHGHADAAVARDARRRQPMVMALRGGLGGALDRYLAGGGRSAHGWLDTLEVVEVPVRGDIGNHNVMPQPWSPD